MIRSRDPRLCSKSMITNGVNEQYLYTNPCMYSRFGESGKGGVVNRFNFYPMMDSECNDIKWSISGDIKALANVCIVDRFNSNGFLKHTVRLLNGRSGRPIQPKAYMGKIGG